MNDLEKINDQFEYYKENNRHIWYKKLNKWEMLLNDNSIDILDKHFFLINKIETYYRFRNIDDFALDKAIEWCYQQIEIAAKSKIAFIKDYKNSKLPAHTGFKQLAIINEKQWNIEMAIKLCKQALNMWWWEWMTAWRENREKRIAKLENKLKKNN